MLLDTFKIKIEWYDQWYNKLYNRGMISVEKH